MNTLGLEVDKGTWKSSGYGWLVRSIFRYIGECRASGIKRQLVGERSPVPPFYSVLSVFVSGVILYFGWGWSHDQITDSRIPEKVYLMANALDFSNSHECNNVA